MVIGNDALISLMHDFAIPAAIEAGKTCMKFFGSVYHVEYKQDLSPLSEADMAANTIIAQLLKKTRIPIISEESSQISYTERIRWETFWLIDPIDGTKEFIKGGNDFTVNIALIHNRVPVLGVIFAPALNTIYFGYATANAFRALVHSNNELTSIVKLPSEKPELVTIVSSKSHKNIATEMFTEKIRNTFQDTKNVSIGSSLKLCMIAEGTASLYPRMGSINEWDIAAGHALVRASG